MFRCNRIQEWIGTAVAIRATDHDHKQVACRLRGFSGASVNFPPARSDWSFIRQQNEIDERRSRKVFTRHWRVYRAPYIRYSARGVICAFVCRSSRRMPGGGGSRSPTDTINLFDYRPTPRPPQQSRRTTSVPPPVVTPSPVGTLNV